ncbi:hypothetical protein QR665_10655, partial [Acinetobacter gerneri]|uniref:hypothetical protein n=1 Tax=Acinetobacter gerneri TaxID=202952 RepID=UPI0029358A3B
MTQQVSGLMITISSEQALKNTQAITGALTNLEIKGVQASKSTDNLGKSFQATNSITQNFNTTINNSTNAINKQTKGLVEQEKQRKRPLNPIPILIRFRFPAVRQQFFNLGHFMRRQPFQH